jgi:cytochrome c-type biogenesis protein CcmH
METWVGSRSVKIRLKSAVGWLIAVASLTVIVAGLWPAADVVDPAVRTQRLATRIACPWCDGQSLAESGADVAADLRRVLAQKVDDGWTDEEIFAFFSDRYGESILLDPPLLGWGLVLWAGPAIALIAGVLVIAGKRARSADYA